jgi:hypothetical protein
MIAHMKRPALLLAAASLAGPAFADPMNDALKSAGGTLCFTRTYDSAWLKAHRGQTIRNFQFALTYDPAVDSAPVLRMRLTGPGKPFYVFGWCDWMAGNLNRGVQDNVLDPTFKPTTGVGCSAMTDTTGVSAEEGGDFPVAWGNGRYVQVHLGGGATGWRSYDVSRGAVSISLSNQDSIFRLNRASASECRGLITKFAPRT